MCKYLSGWLKLVKPLSELVVVWTAVACCVHGGMQAVGFCLDGLMLMTPIKLDVHVAASPFLFVKYIAWQQQFLGQNPQARE